MKCPSCGNGLHIEDEKCPYCGKENPYYKKHRLAMRKYQKDFNEVKEEVYKKTGSFTGLNTKIKAIAILAVLNLVLLLLGRNAWNIRYFYEEKRIEKHNEEYMAVLDRLESEKDYFALGAYWTYAYSYHTIDNEYFQVSKMGVYYRAVYEDLMDLMNDDGYMDVEKKIKYLCEHFEMMYEFAKQDEYDNPECFTEKHLSAMNDMKEEVKCLLITYGNLTEEEAEMFETYSSGQKQLALERGLGGYAE